MTDLSERGLPTERRSVGVLSRIYASCLEGRDEIAMRRIAEALP
jgi:hypothetical protein